MIYVTRRAIPLPWSGTQTAFSPIFPVRLSLDGESTLKSVEADARREPSTMWPQSPQPPEHPASKSWIARPHTARGLMNGKLPIRATGRPSRADNRIKNGLRIHDKVVPKSVENLRRV